MTTGRRAAKSTQVLEHGRVSRWTRRVGRQFVGNRRRRAPSGTRVRRWAIGPSLDGRDADCPRRWRLIDRRMLPNH
ncbi:hypothetical protein GLA29479_1675 [Lysobacter antibioticus]|uniref:Uncharacterized protein n=1 Tax=Lysobacter antibioticus TaxID=84531 RepID=A0A0S2DVR0_LYSAN|nr:hypothetical protein GLA29479_1675 [Lysobacter antibioticus]ALN80297.1 hypothetical protein LA76x_2158 [Lysobacter antibioticus]